MRRNNRFKKEPDKNQKKITQFFTRPQSGNNNDTINSSTNLSTANTSISIPARPPCRPKWTDDGDYTDIEVLEPPPPSPKELVDLISSSDENEVVDKETNRDNKHIIKTEPPESTTTAARFSFPPPSELVNSDSNGSKAGSSSSGDDILSQVDIDELVRSSQENLSSKPVVETSLGSPFSDSSGDEVLSQIDVDEIIRSSQSSKSSNEDDNGSHSSLSPSLLSTPDKENRHYDDNSFQRVVVSSPSSTIPVVEQIQSGKTFKSPRKISPKSQLNKFSPIRHLRVKRTSSEASLDATVSIAESAYSASPSYSSPSKISGFVRNSSQSPTKRRLDFGTTATSTSGQARYFLRNFLNILTEVVTDTFHAHLIHTEDHRLLQDFVTLSIDAQHLYVRLFQRKWCWKPVTKLNYKNKELPDDLTEACTELQSKNFIEQISPTNCGSLEDVLDTLDLGKMASLSRKMRLNPTKKTKEAFKAALLSSQKNQKTLTGVVGSANTCSIILKHALNELGPAYRVSCHSKLLFGRLFLLHSPPQYWEVENDQASNQLLIVLLNQMGQMEYPSYTIFKSTRVYLTREHLAQFHDAFSLHSNLVAFTESKDWIEVVSLANQAKISLEGYLTHQDTQQHDLELPSFLRIYTAGSVLTHSLWLGVDGFQKLKQIKESNQLIRFLLNQDVYLTNYRGRWWERLVINSETHLKKSKEDVKALLEEALKDKHLKENHRLTLSQRLEKTRAALEKKGGKKKMPPKAKPKRKTKRKATRRRKQYVDESEDETDDDEIEVEERKTKNEDFVCTDNNVDTQVVMPEEEDDKVPKELVVETLFLKNEIPTRTITGEKLDQGPGAMGKSVFISRQDSSGSKRMGSVEQFVIDYYLEQHGYTCGIHGEGSTVTTIYGLLFWDVIFSDGIPDAFHHRYQPFPLDLHFEDFYHRRKQLIDEKLFLIRKVLAMEDLFGVVDEIWAKHEKKLSIVNWSMFEDNVDRLKNLMKAMGSKMIADICERLAKNYRHYSSGFPDLVVWRDSGEHNLFSGGECDDDASSSNDSNKKMLFVEVKGPGDHLSEKQQLWLDFLIDNGIPAEVCLVKAVSNKRIRLDKR